MKEKEEVLEWCRRSCWEKPLLQRSAGVFFYSYLLVRRTVVVEGKTSDLITYSTRTRENITREGVILKSITHGSFCAHFLLY